MYLLREVARHKRQCLARRVLGALKNVCNGLVLEAGRLAELHEVPPDHFQHAVVATFANRHRGYQLGDGFLSREGLGMGYAPCDQVSGGDYGESSKSCAKVCCGIVVSCPE